MKIKKAFGALAIAAISLFGLGVATLATQMVGQKAAHASSIEYWYDNNYDQPAQAAVYANTGNMAVDGPDGTTADEIGVLYTGGHWCIWDATADNGYYIGISGTNALFDTYSGSCNVGGDEWSITCQGGAGNQGYFFLTNLHNNDLVGLLNTGSVVLHTVVGSGQIAFYDASKTECQY